MSFLDKLSETLRTSQEKERLEKQKKAIALRELRDASIPIINIYVEKYNVMVKFLDTDAYIYVIENEKERGIYIPYGKDDETELDLKIDNFVHNFESASKHKAKGLLGKSADIFLKIGDGYNTVDDEVKNLEPKQKGGGFWNNTPTIKDLKTSTGNGGWLDGKATKIINTNTNPGNSFGSTNKSKKPINLNTNPSSLSNTKSSKDRKPIPEYIKDAVRKRAKHRCENQDCRVSDKDVRIEFHHKNGDRNDNRLENIVYLCPNCHSTK
jgi:hypothetical protein